MKNLFKLKSDYKPNGDQPGAIKDVCEWIKNGEKESVILGVTGSGKTFTMANIIAETGKPALIMAHNKTLAAQLYEEFKAFFPDNAVEYFVSYYDYYQPEAYVARRDLYIEKTASINEQIDRLRHAATRALFERPDVIIIASVSCIYGIGDPESYADMKIPLHKGDTIERDALLRKLIELQYSRNDSAFFRGTFRVKGDTLDIYPAHMEDAAWRLSFFDDELEDIKLFDPLTGEKLDNLESVTVYPNSHYVVPRPTILKAMDTIKKEMIEHTEFLDSQGKLVEKQRIEERVTFDLEMMQASGYCNGIENYSRHLTGRPQGAPPPTLFDYMPDDSLLFVDESHVSVSQVGAMSKGDAARKQNLVEYGFRLPSARDNRPLTFEEWDARRPQTVYVSATPQKHETDRAGDNITELVVRPTGLIDPVVEIRPVEGQVDDLMAEIVKTTKRGFRTLVTTLTKKMAEQLTEYLHENGVKVRYLHSDIDTLERAEILRDLRLGAFDVLIGINLLREGLDLPEVGVVAILDADKEGFLRSTTSLIQTIGRAARNAEGKAVLYADRMTDSMKAAIDETDRRRSKQIAYNTEHGITPQTILKEVRSGLQDALGKSKEEKQVKILQQRADKLGMKDIQKDIETLKKEMIKAADDLEFEKAAEIRDRVHELEELHMKLS
ncbi:MAG: excinuclease ABC subunit UvrB [Alphaproteobacteria bacterium]|nr:excinuclease ABC subunit UvrB [Alphaproteobacteria bacterium]